MLDLLGKRIKENYEHRTRYLLPRRTYTILRADGKAFSNYTSNFYKPFDKELMMCMQETAKFMCKEIQGAKIAYTQSDEISIVLTDFEKETTDSWFDGNIQKMCSVAASIATAKFNELISIYASAKKPDRLALFDCRAFTIPDPTEVENYIIWRQQDSSRNSVSMLAQSLYSHKQLNGKNSTEMQEMCFQKGHNWNDLPIHEKRGATIIKETYVTSINAEADMFAFECALSLGREYVPREVTRSRWIIDEPPIFTQDRDYLRKHIPKYPV